ncbi:uncharacterized protein LOC116343270 [Contarinia nasturtii]|uniref:uncharacterized protein LOC116343270 n=1 Tax=Contarinia nasturtii TaxID=265458 RepID=UPI0012D4385E|nr:uncharacterized protein LOC116343270 [Contarinia nasturtii]
MLKLFVILCIISVVFGGNSKKPAVYPTSVSSIINVAKVEIDVSYIENAKKDLTIEDWTKICMGSTQVKSKFKMSKLVPNFLKKEDAIVKIGTKINNLVNEFQENYTKNPTTYYSDSLFESHKTTFEKCAKNLAEIYKKDGLQELVASVCQDMYNNMLIMYEARPFTSGNVRKFTFAQEN